MLMQVLRHLFSHIFFPPVKHSTAAGRGTVGLPVCCSVYGSFPQLANIVELPAASHNSNDFFKIASLYISKCGANAKSTDKVSSQHVVS